MGWAIYKAHRAFGVAVLSTLLACGSAAEFGGDTTSGSGAAASDGEVALNTDYYDVVIDPQHGTTLISPQSLTAAAQQILGFSAAGSQYLADTLGVTFNNATWVASEYDSNNNQIYLDGAGSGACVTNASSTQYVNNVKVTMSLFNPTSAYATDGAVSTGSNYVVNYGTIPPSASGTACDQPRFVNPSGASFRFSAALSYGGFVSTPTVAINNVSSYQWRYAGYPPGIDYTVSGSGFTTSNCNIFLGSTLINYDSSVSITRTDTQLTVNVRNILPGVGALRVNGGSGCSSTTTAGYVSQFAKVSGNFQRSSGSAVTTNLFWFWWDNGSPSINGTTKCPSGFTDQMRQSNVTVSTTPTTLSWNNLHSTDASGIQGFAVYLDLNGNGVIDSGDLYSSNFCVGCSIKGRSTNISGTFSSAAPVTATCSY